MSSHTLSKFGSLAVKLVALVVALFFLGDLARAQEEPYPKVELFGGYSYIYPNSRLHAVNPAIDANQEGNPRGIGLDFTYNFNHWFGLTADFSGTFFGAGETPAQLAILDDMKFYNFSVGPKLTYRRKHFAPFVEGMFGWHRFTEEDVPLVGTSDTWGFMLGGGIDVPLTRHFGLRLLRGDYVYSTHQFQPEALVDTTRIRGLRAQTGFIFMFGYPPDVAPTLACNLTPAEVLAGEPVTVTATPAGFRRNRKLTYTWTTNATKVSGTDDHATVDTTGLAAGSYTVSATATERHATAQCSASLAVRAAMRNPPVVSCTPNPGTVKSGEESVITCDCTSPDSRPVSLSAWNASSGTLAPSTTNTARLNTAGLSASTVNVGVTCTDDRGLTAMGSTAVNVEVPVTPQASKINECAFGNHAKPARVDNACKAVLDQVADLLQHDPNSKAVIIGETDAGEKGNDLAAQRAVNAKAYLTGGENQKGIDPNRIDVRTGAGGMRDEIWIVPAGATFNQPDTSPVDETKIKPRK